MSASAFPADLPSFMNPEADSMRNLVPVACTQSTAPAQEASGAARQTNGMQFDGSGHLSIDSGITQKPGPNSDPPSDTVESAEPDDAVPATTGGDEFLSAGSPSCNGTTTPATSADSTGTAAPPTQVSGRLRAAVQALAMTASLVLITLLAFLVSAMTRKSSHPSSTGRHRVPRY